MESSNKVASGTIRNKRQLENSEENVSPKRERMETRAMSSNLCHKCTASLENHLSHSCSKAARTRRARARHNLFKEVADYTQKYTNEDALSSESKKDKITEKRDSTVQTSAKSKYAVDIGVGDESDCSCPDRNIRILFNNSENFLKHDSEISVSPNNSAVDDDEAIYDELDTAVNRSKASHSRVKKTIAKPTTFLSNLMAKIPSYRRGTGKKQLCYYVNSDWKSFNNVKALLSFLANIRLNLLREHLVQKQSHHPKGDFKGCHHKIPKIPLRGNHFLL